MINYKSIAKKLLAGLFLIGLSTASIKYDKKSDSASYISPDSISAMEKRATEELSVFRKTAHSKMEKNIIEESTMLRQTAHSNMEKEMKKYRTLDSIFTVTDADSVSYNGKLFTRKDRVTIKKFRFQTAEIYRKYVAGKLF